MLLSMLRITIASMNLAVVVKVVIDVLYRLHSASMEVGSASVPSLARLRGVEKCLCPPGYAGLSCEVSGTHHLYLISISVSIIFYGRLNLLPEL